MELKTERFAVKMTPNHLLPVSSNCENGASFSMGMAKDVVPGNCVRTVDGISQIVSVRRLNGYGVYTAVAQHPHGQIVVNGIVASSFAVSHSIVNSYYHIHRAMTAVFPKWVLESPKIAAGNSFIGDVALSFLSIFSPV